MRAISIRQPYAELTPRGMKTAELRSISTTIVGKRFYILREPGQGKVAEVRLPCLADCPGERRFRVARIIDQDPAFLQFVERCGLMAGVNVTVEVRDELAGAVWVRPGERRPIPLGTSAAAKILVE